MGAIEHSLRPRTFVAVHSRCSQISLTGRAATRHRHIEIDLNFPVIQMVYTMYGLFTVRLGTSVREYSKCNIVRFI